MESIHVISGAQKLSAGAVRDRPCYPGQLFGGLPETSRSLNVLCGLWEL